LRSHDVPSVDVSEKNRGSAARRGSILKFLFAHGRWRGISSKNGMPVFSGANLIGGLVFGSIGFVAFIYGKRMHVWKPMFIGLVLMAYPYFVENDMVMLAIGVVGTAALFLFRE
jgi:hypothetical protein